MGQRGPKPGTGGRPKKAIADKIQDKGLTDIETEKHTYGGFLGIGQKTCIISTQYVIYEIYCDAGHLNEVRRVVFAQSHSSCGQ